MKQDIQIEDRRLQVAASQPLPDILDRKHYLDQSYRANTESEVKPRDEIMERSDSMVKDIQDMLLIKKM